MILSPIHCPTLVGRREQLGFLAERALAAAQGSGSVVLMEGDAGCGKTRLVTEFCRNLPAQGLRYAHGDCLEYAKQPFSPWIAVSRALLGFQPALTLTDVEREILSRLMPELGNGSVAAVESDKLQQFEALASFLK
ncbi:MAG TPA: ATP-binding protein, partial [Candidatus Eremiobacteraceae bacterium]|nr:ATP-binding protein [Candidatus Eremiobacteraceae bacterium]